MVIKIKNHFNYEIQSVNWTEITVKCKISYISLLYWKRVWKKLIYQTALLKITKNILTVKCIFGELLALRKSNHWSQVLESLDKDDFFQWNIQKKINVTNHIQTKLAIEIMIIYTIKYNSLHKKWSFSIKDFFSKCDQIRSFLRIWLHLLKKSLTKNFIFCAVTTEKP